MNSLSKRLLISLAATSVAAAGLFATAGPGGAATTGSVGAVRPTVAGDHDVAPLVGTSAPDVIKNRYIVVLRDLTAGAQVASAEAQVKDGGGRIHHRYASALRGFAATVSAKSLAALRSDPDVAYVEADRKITLASVQSPATWGLDRIDQHSRSLNNRYFYTSTGAGVKAYVIDTGIRHSHAEFGGRAVEGYDVFGGDGTDCNGHGTHVAGSIGGSTYGVAKKVTLVSVRVLDCEGGGSLSGVIAGVNWVTADHAVGTPAVANMSLGGSPSSALDGAVNNSLRDRVSYAVAAGNDGESACWSSPARLKGAITVGATRSDDFRATYSNYGSCLDLFAPGSSIRSAWPSSDTASAVLSGTSMASPHVAGTAALYLHKHPGATPSAVRDALVTRSTKSVVAAAGSTSPNRLLYSRDL